MMQKLSNLISIIIIATFIPTTCLAGVSSDALAVQAMGQTTERDAVKVFIPQHAANTLEIIRHEFPDRAFTPAELSDRLSVDRKTISYYLKRLTKEELVRSIGRARAIRYQLTHRGKTAKITTVPKGLDRRIVEIVLAIKEILDEAEKAEEDPLTIYEISLRLSERGWFLTINKIQGYIEKDYVQFGFGEHAMIARDDEGAPILRRREAVAEFNPSDNEAHQAAP